MSVRHFDGSFHRDPGVGADVHDHVADRSFQRRVGIHAQELGRDRTRSALGARAVHQLVELNRSAAGRSRYRTLCRRQPDAAAARLEVGASSDFSDFDAAAAGGRTHVAAAVLHIDAAAAGLHHHCLVRSADADAAAAGFRAHLALGGIDLDAAAARVQVQFAGAVGHFHGAAARFRRYRAGNVGQAHAAAAAGRVHTAGNVAHRDTATLGFGLDGFQFTRSIDREIDGKIAVITPLRAAFQYRGPAANGGRDAEPRQLAPRRFFRIRAHPLAHLVRKSLLRSALHVDRSSVGADPQAACPRQRSRDLLDPVIAVAVYLPGLCREGQGHGRHQRRQHREFKFAFHFLCSPNSLQELCVRYECICLALRLAPWA